MVKNYRQYRSKGEGRIAEFLGDCNIDFKYEYPLAVRDRGLVKIWYPDFFLPGFCTIIEYFGVNGSSEYDRQLAHKVDVYKQAGIEGIFLVESSMMGDWQKGILDRLEYSLEDKLGRLRTSREPKNRIV